MPPSVATASPDSVTGHLDELLADLRNAEVTLNVNTIADVARQISDRDPELGAVLAECAARFAYTAILDGLEGIKADYVG